MTHVVDVFFPGGTRVEVVSNDTLEFPFENGEASGELLSAVFDVEVEFLDKLLESVVLNLAPVGFSLGNSGNECNQKCRIH